MALEIPGLKASDLVEMLRRHYLPDGRPPGGIFAAEIESPDGRRRADVLWAPWSIAGGAGLVGHEVKVSRSDVLTELADPMKAEPWARHCSRWWLVVSHPALVDGLDVPSAWGIMAPPSGRRTRSMTVVRPAPLLKPVDTGPAWRRIATWDHTRLEDRLRDVTYEASRHKSDAEYARRELTQIQLAGQVRESPHAVRLGQLLEALEKRHWTGGRVDVEDIAAAIVDVEAHRALAREARSELKYLADEARRIASPMARVADQLDELAKKGPK